MLWGGDISVHTVRNLNDLITIKSSMEQVVIITTTNVYSKLQYNPYYTGWQRFPNMGDKGPTTSGFNFYFHVPYL